MSWQKDWDSAKAAAETQQGGKIVLIEGALYVYMDDGMPHVLHEGPLTKREAFRVLEGICLA